MQHTNIIFLDGGLGTTLEDEHGVKFDSRTTPLWSSHLLFSEDGRRLLKECQSRFRKAGADILSTGTYQVSEEGIARTPFCLTSQGNKGNDQQESFGMNRGDITTALTKGIDITLQAWSEELATDCINNGLGGVALSLGPYGACMIPAQEYSGRYDAEHKTENELFKWHVRRLGLFLPDAADTISRLQFIAFETIPVLAEIRAVRRAIRTLSLEATPFWISCVFPNDDAMLPDGNSVEAVVKAMLEGDEPRPFAIGLNCTKVHNLARLVSLFEDSVDALVKNKKIPKSPTLILYPDGTNGEVYDTVTQTWKKMNPKQDMVSLTTLLILDDQP